MEPVRSLRELFSALSGGHSGAESDPAAMLAAEGHGDLPGHLMAEAIVNYADTAPVEVAEHLSDFVMAHSAVPGVDPGPEHFDGGGADGLALLSSAPDPAPVAEDLDGLTPGTDATHLVAPEAHLHDAPQDAGHDTPADLGFGHGHDQALAPDAPADGTAHPVHDASAAASGDWALPEQHHLDDGLDQPAAEHSWADADHSTAHHVDAADHHVDDGLDLGDAG
jgi:hypothetical protein